MLVVNLVYRADVRMIQGRGGFGFPLEAAESLCILGHIIGQELEGDKPSELDIFGFVHDTHPTSAQLLDYAVVRDGFAEHGAKLTSVRPACQRKTGRCSFWK